METRISLPFADGVYDFWLPMAQVIAAEREMGIRDKDGIIAPRSILAAFHDIGQNLAEIGDEIVLAGPSPARVHDAQAIIRNALIGGNRGMVNGEEVPVDANGLIAVYCYPARPAIHDVGLAWRILNAAIYGVVIEKKNEVQAESQALSTKA